MMVMIRPFLPLDLSGFTPSSSHRRVSNKDKCVRSSENIFRGQKNLSDSNKVDVVETRKIVIYFGQGGAYW